MNWKLSVRIAKSVSVESCLVVMIINVRISHLMCQIQQFCCDILVVLCHV